MKRAPGGFFLFALATLAACASVPAEHFYTLTADAPGRLAPADGAADIGVSMGPVTIAEMVDRPQLVVQVAAHRVVILEQQRWAQPLASEIPRVVALNLARWIGTAQAFARPPIAGPDATFRVGLDVQRFDTVVGQEVCVEVAWTVRRQAGGQLISGRSVVHEPVSASGYDAIVAAHSRALAVLSRDIAVAINRFTK